MPLHICKFCFELNVAIKKKRINNPLKNTALKTLNSSLGYPHPSLCNPNSMNKCGNGELKELFSTISHQLILNVEL